ncbi:ribbon-helix-helix domain-containing protein [Pelagibacterium lacus]|uniref:Aryl-sulfate sulfotransferase n=1 Tax=Pelagibacterium lacus TaxID=2282655 RepID=A0A369W6A1_9HYPH|nr:ribbon-helix-helix domain-containing protein [Pelagibacterium lacus]RDE10196.1 aryl-sulfate sulfotransferase [Pelagibacterium lacus]
MRKRSLTISGHRTSIALEPAFWDALERMAASRGLTVPQLIARIDEERAEPNLSSSLRVAILGWALSERL